VWVTLLGEPKKYVVLGEREQVEENPDKPKKREELLGGILRMDKWRRGRSRTDEPKKSSPAGFPKLVEMSKGVNKGKTGRRG
jgi:hypothetical protein